MADLAQALGTEVTEDSIALLVDRFYAKVRQDMVLAPVFDAAIAPDAWADHLATMRRFWSSVILTSGRYSGNPVAVHRALPSLRPDMFMQWLTLFEATSTELFAPDTAARFTLKAQRIAASLRLALFHRPGAPPEGLTQPAGRAS